MARPKSLKEIPLIPGELTIQSSEFDIGFIGTIDNEGRIPKVGKEHAGKGVIVLIKKVK